MSAEDLSPDSPPPTSRGAGSEDPWAWVDASPVPPPDLASYEVTAVLVAHNGAEWLPQALTALGRLDLRPDRVIAVDAGSTDGTAQLLAQAQASRIVSLVVTDPPGPDRQSMAVSVRHALTARGPVSEDEWIWLLHDDAVPAPDALRQLLITAAELDGDIVGPKLVHPRTRQQPQRVSELGVSVSATGRREVHVAPGDIDQGQYDERGEVLGTSTCGMLVKRGVLDDLGGLAEVVPGHRDGVEFCWRAHLAGRTVVIAPAAEVAHRQVGLAGLRVGSDDAPAQDRALGMNLAAVHARGPGRVFAPLGLVLAALLRALGYLIGKAPDRAADEMSAVRRFLAGGTVRRTLRSSVARLTPSPDLLRRTRELRPGRLDSLRRAVDAAGASWAERQIASGSAAASIDELTGDDFAGRGFNPRRPWQSAYALAIGVAVIVALIAGRTLLRTGHLASASLLPATDGLGAAWAQWLAPLADGSSAPPWLGLTALASTITLGQPEWFVTLLIMLGVPLAMLAAHPFLRRVLDDRRVRVWAGVTYGLVPVLLGGTNQGRLTLFVLALLLPVLGVAVHSIITRATGGPEGWRGGFAAGLALTGIVAFQPVLGIVAVLGAVVGILLVSGLGRRLRFGIMLLVPLVALAPWWPALLAHPGRALLGPDPIGDPSSGWCSGDACSALPPAPLDLLLGRVGGAGLPPLWLSAIVVGVIWLVALAGVLLRPRHRLVLIGWGLALAGLALAAVLSRLVVSAPPLGSQVRPWVGGLLLVALVGVLLAAAVGIDDLGRTLSGRSFSALQPLTAAAAVVLAVTAVLSAGWWVVAGATGPSITRTSMEALPSYLRLSTLQRPGSAVLAIDLPVEDQGQPRYSLITGDQLRLGDVERGLGFGTAQRQQETASAVRRIAAGAADASLAEDLAGLGITHLWIRGTTAEGTTMINSTPGLRVGSGNTAGRAWVVEPEPTLTAPAPTPARAVWIAAAQGIWLLVAGFLAAPSLRRSESRDPVQTARRAARSDDARSDDARSDDARSDDAPPDQRRSAAAEGGR